MKKIICLIVSLTLIISPIIVYAGSGDINFIVVKMGWVLNGKPYVQGDFIYVPYKEGWWRSDGVNWSSRLYSTPGVAKYSKYSNSIEYNDYIKDENGNIVYAPIVKEVSVVQAMGNAFKTLFYNLLVLAKTPGEIVATTFKSLYGSLTEVYRVQGTVGEGGTFGGAGAADTYSIPVQVQEDGEYVTEIRNKNGDLIYSYGHYVDTKPCTIDINPGTYQHVPQTTVDNDKVFGVSVMIDNTEKSYVNPGQSMDITETIKQAGPGYHQITLVNQVTKEVISTTEITVIGPTGPAQPPPVDPETGEEITWINPGKIGDDFESKLPLEQLKKSLDKLKELSKLDYHQLAPHLEINLNELLNPAVSVIAPELTNKLDYKVTYLDFSPLNNIKFQGIPVIDYFRGLISAGMYFMTAFYIWRRITPKDTIAK